MAGERDHGKTKPAQFRKQKHTHTTQNNMPVIFLKKTHHAVIFLSRRLFPAPPKTNLDVTQKQRRRGPQVHDDHRGHGV